jgi:hypothetical protein
MLLRLRFRLEFSDRRRAIFAGLGRTGWAFDFTSRRGSLKLAGFTVKELEAAEKKKVKPEPEPKPPPKPKKKRAKRERPIGDMLRVAPKVMKAVASYGLSLLRALRLEELDGEIKAGFDQPDLTGTAYGYYQAAAATLPGIGDRFRYRPDWDGPSLAGSARVAVAIPLYSIVVSTVVLILKLPLRDLIKLAIGKKKGDQDVQ